MTCSISKEDLFRFFSSREFFIFIFWLYLQHIEVPRSGIKPVPQQRPEPLRWQPRSLNLMHLKRAPLSRFLVFFFLTAAPAAHGSSQARGWIRAAAEAYTTATTTQNPSLICDLRRSLHQHWILNSLSEARDQTCILTETMQVFNPLSRNENSLLFFNSLVFLTQNLKFLLFLIHLKNTLLLFCIW